MANKRENRAQAIECEAHLEAGMHVPATTHSTNPDWCGYELCEECAAEYDGRQAQGEAKMGTWTEKQEQILYQQYAGGEAA